MGSTAHVGIDTFYINDPNGPCMVLWQPSTPHLARKKRPLKLVGITIFYTARLNLQSNIQDSALINQELKPFSYKPTVLGGGFEWQESTGSLATATGLRKSVHDHEEPFRNSE